MKQAEITLMARTGALHHVTLYRDARSEGRWAVYAYRDEEGSPNSEWAWIKNVVETARGGARTWSSLDTAFRWVREEVGFSGPVNVDG